MKHLWFDPGDTTGWALFEDDRPISMGKLTYPDQLFGSLSHLMSLATDLVGCENYRLNPKGAKYGYTPSNSEVIAVRVIGAIELAHFLVQPTAQLVYQEKDIKPVGYGFAGLRYVKGAKGKHMEDAIAHGAYYWMQVGRHAQAQ